MRDFFVLLNEYPWTAVLCVLGIGYLFGKLRGER